jgi:hypothetical protein
LALVLCKRITTFSVPFAGPCSPTDAVSWLAEQRLGRVAMLDFEVPTVAEVCELLTSGGVIDEARRDPDCSVLRNKTRRPEIS